MARTALITGGAGFLGRALVRRLAADGLRVVVFDALTYAAHEADLRAIDGEIELLVGDVADADALDGAVARHRPDAVLHLAAETHVDRALLDAAPFLRTNVLGTAAAVRACLRHRVRLVHVGTDEVYGDRAGRPDAAPSDPAEPTNAYAASKACGDHLVLAAVRADGLDAVVTRGANTCGPGQFPEKLLPLAARRWARGEPAPLYGDGRQERQWIGVDEHAAGIAAAIDRGDPGAVVHLGGEALTNRAILRAWAEALGHAWDDALLRPVPDRKGHDRRYGLRDAESRALLGIPRAALDLAPLAAWTQANPGFWDEALNRPAVRAYFTAQYGGAP